MRAYRPPSVWGPFSTVVNVLTFFVGVGLIFSALFLVLLPLGGDVTFHSDREGQLCAVAGDLPLEGSDVKDVDVRGQLGATDERTTNTFASEVLVCQAKKGLDHKAAKYGLKLLTIAPTYTVYLAFLFGIRRVMNQTDRGGPFGHDTARLVVRLGWWLFGGLIAATLIQTCAQSLLLGMMVEGQTWGEAVKLDFPAVMILGALGIVGVGHVLANGATLQDDVEGTV